MSDPSNEKRRKLDEYRAKRSADATPEPLSSEPLARPGLFVVHEHAARNLHFDLRLELDGTLVSWAVPKGPSLDPAVKRLAVRVEDHPVEYGDFEGRIPEGNYGAGAVIVWDRGRWVPLQDPREGLERGKLLFELHGYKLRGVWTLFRTKRSERDWLLVKKPDAYAGEHDLPRASVLSGLSVEQLRDGVDPAENVRARLRRLRVRRGRVHAQSLEVMLPTTGETPFSDPGWIYELKYDGFRMLAVRDGDRAWLRYRRGREATAAFPEVAAAVHRLPYSRLTIDGEIVVLDEQARPSFQRLQQRFQIRGRAEIARAAVALPATFVAFDLLEIEGYDTRRLPLTERKELLREVLPPAGPLHYADHVEAQGQAVFDRIREMGLEGMVAKKADSPYRSGRSGDWLRFRLERSDDFVIVGYTEPAQGRTGFGALHLAAWDGDDLVWAGRVGTGFDDRRLSEIRAALEPLQREEPACTGTPARGRNVWVDPKLIAEVRHKEWTDAGQLRHPVFLRLRDDKGVRECVRPGCVPPSAPPADPAPAVRTVRFTNLDKVFWPEQRYTKGDLIGYYRSVSSRMLPYLADRPVVLTRYPDGIEGKSFFQKDAPGFVPDWIRIETMWSEHARREIRYFVCEEEETLLYLANMASIPLHVWSSRVATLQKPDWCILDLDPTGTPFAHVIRVARAIRSLCDEIGLDTFVKTSGSKGLHVLVPLGRQCTYEQSRSLGQLLGRLVAADLPEIATIRRAKRAREGKVYIDWVQNGHGRLLVAPLSVRPLPGAPVSTPLEWSEVGTRLDPGRFTLRTVPRRLARMKRDPMLDVLTATPDLLAALDTLHRLL